MSCPVREACPSARTMSGSRRLSPVRRLAPTVPPTSALTRCRRAPAPRQLLRPSYRLRLTKIRACSPSFSGSPICCAPTRRRLPAKLLVRLCQSGRRRLKQRISEIENCRARQWRKHSFDPPAAPDGSASFAAVAAVASASHQRFCDHQMRSSFSPARMSLMLARARSPEG